MARKWEKELAEKQKRLASRAKVPNKLIEDRPGRFDLPDSFEVNAGLLAAIAAGFALRNKVKEKQFPRYY